MKRPPTPRFPKLVFAAFAVALFSAGARAQMTPQITWGNDANKVIPGTTTPLPYPYIYEIANNVPNPQTYTIKAAGSVLLNGWTLPGKA